MDNVEPSTVSNRPGTRVSSRIARKESDIPDLFNIDERLEQLGRSIGVKRKRDGQTYKVSGSKKARPPDRDQVDASDSSTSPPRDVDVASTVPASAYVSDRFAREGAASQLSVETDEGADPLSSASPAPRSRRSDSEMPYPPDGETGRPFANRSATPINPNQQMLQSLANISSNINDVRINSIDIRNDITGVRSDVMGLGGEITTLSHRVEALEQSVNRNRPEPGQNLQATGGVQAVAAEQQRGEADVPADGYELVNYLTEMEPVKYEIEAVMKMKDEERDASDLRHGTHYVRDADMWFKRGVKPINKDTDAEYVVFPGRLINSVKDLIDDKRTSRQAKIIEATEAQRCQQRIYYYVHYSDRGARKIAKDAGLKKTKAGDNANWHEKIKRIGELYYLEIGGDMRPCRRWPQVDVVRGLVMMPSEVVSTEVMPYDPSESREVARSHGRRGFPHAGHDDQRNARGEDVRRPRAVSL